MKVVAARSKPNKRGQALDVDVQDYLNFLLDRIPSVSAPVAMAGGVKKDLQAALTKGLPMAYKNMAEYVVPIDEVTNIARGKNVLGNAAMAGLYFSGPWKAAGRVLSQGRKPVMASVAQLRALLRLYGADRVG